MWSLRDLTVHGANLYASGQFPAEASPSGVDRLAVFDTRGPGVPKMFLRTVRDTAPGAGTGLIIHDQALYFGSSGSFAVLDLQTQSPVMPYRLDRTLFSEEYPACAKGLGDAGSDLLLIECSGGLLKRLPYVRTPMVQTSEPQNQTAGGFTLRSRLNPNDSPTSAFFQHIPVSGVLSGTADLTVSATLTNLTPNTLYYYRLVASNAFGVSYGRSQTVYMWATAQAASLGEPQRAEAAPAAARPM